MDFPAKRQPIYTPSDALSKSPMSERIPYRHPDRAKLHVNSRALLPGYSPVYSEKQLLSLSRDEAGRIPDRLA
jgi:hypothetical protein